MSGLKKFRSHDVSKANAESMKSMFFQRPTTLFIRIRRGFLFLKRLKRVLKEGGSNPIDERSFAYDQ